MSGVKARCSSDLLKNWPRLLGKYKRSFVHTLRFHHYRSRKSLSPWGENAILKNWFRLLEIVGKFWIIPFKHCATFQRYDVWLSTAYEGSAMFGRSFEKLIASFGNCKGIFKTLFEHCATSMEIVLIIAVITWKRNVWTIFRKIDRVFW